MTDDQLALRVKRVSDALSGFDMYGPDQLIRAQTGEQGGFSFSFGPERAVTAERLLNEAGKILTAICSLRDHVDAYCDSKLIPRVGKDVVKSSKPLGLLHDLWNIDKHQKRDRNPYSGFSPTLRLQTVVSISGDKSCPNAFVSVDHETGIWEQQGNVELLLVGQIYNENGEYVADFRQTCDEATSIWIEQLKAMGFAL